MAERKVSEDDVEAIVAHPKRGTYDPAARDRREHFGFSADGRQVNVVTNRARTVVITVVAE